MSEILGYERPQGPPGIRNVLLAMFTVECASFVAQSIAAMDLRIHSMGFPGCYVNPYATRMMEALGSHPNVGAVLLLSLGCEGTNPYEVAEKIAQSGRRAEVLRIQDTGGTEKTITAGQRLAGEMLAELDETPRCAVHASDLIIGTECGGSDATSGIAANPAVGAAFDLLVDEGATVMLEETLEALGLGEIASRRGATPEAASALQAVIKKAEKFAISAEQFSMAPGNRAGGLTTIEEKSMGAFAKSGSRPIQGVIQVSQQPPRNGLFLLDTVPDPSPFPFGYSNPNDSEGILALISCGAHIVIFTTGRGSVIGSVISPVLKVCGNPITYDRMAGDMDVNAGRIIRGEATIPEVGREIFDLTLEVAAGQETKAEKLGHREYCIPYKFQSGCILK